MKCPADISKYTVTLEKLRLMLADDKKKAFEGSSKAERSQEALRCTFIIARDLGLLDLTLGSILNSIPDEGVRKSLGLAFDMVQAYVNGTEFTFDLDIDAVRKSLDTLMASVQLKNVDAILDDLAQQINNLKKAYNDFKKATAKKIVTTDEKKLDPWKVDNAASLAVTKLETAIEILDRVRQGKTTGPAIEALEEADKAILEALLLTEDTTIRELEKLDIAKTWLALDRAINSLGGYLQRSWWEKELEASPNIKKLVDGSTVAFDTMLAMVGIKKHTEETKAFKEWVSSKSQEWWLGFVQGVASGDFLDTLASEVQSSNRVYYQLEDLMSKLLDASSSLRGSALLYKTSRVFLYQLQDSLNESKAAVGYAKAQLKHSLGDYVIGEKSKVNISTSLVIGLAKTAFAAVGPDLAIMSGTLSLAIGELKKNFLDPAMKDMTQFFNVVTEVKTKALTAEQLLLSESEQEELRSYVRTVVEALQALDLFGMLTGNLDGFLSQIKGLKTALGDASGFGMNLLKKITPTLGPVLMKAVYQYAKSKFPEVPFDDMLNYFACITQILGVTLRSEQDIESFKKLLFR